MVVPVDDHVDVVGDRGVYHAFDFGDFAGGLLLVAQRTGMDAEGGAGEGDVPVFHQPVDGFGRVEFSFPLAPKMAHAMHGNGFAVIAYDAITVGAKAAIFFDNSSEQGRGRCETKGEDQRGFHERPKVDRNHLRSGFIGRLLVDGLHVFQYG